MSDTSNIGGAGPALATHSKDAATSGQTPAASTSGKTEGFATGDAGSSATASAQVSDMASKFAGQAREAAGHAKESVSQMADTARQQIAKRGGSAADQVMNFVREQPVAAVLTAGAVCLALGVLLGRR